MPWTLAPGYAARSSAAEAAAYSALREPMTTGKPAFAHRRASPPPSAPVPPTTLITSVEGPTRLSVAIRGNSTLQDKGRGMVLGTRRGHK